MDDPLLEYCEHIDDGRPFYIEDLDMSQGSEHNAVVRYLGNFFQEIADRAGYIHLSDHYVWYRNPETGARLRRAPDLMLAKPDTDITGITAYSLLFVMEVVSILEKRVERKDTVEMKARNQMHGVPEYVLYFPDMKDERAIQYFRLDEASGRYKSVGHNGQGFYDSVSIPGMRLCLLPPYQWRPGRKVDIYWGAEKFLPYREMKSIVAKERERLHATEGRLHATEGRLHATEGRLHSIEEQLRQERDARREAQAELEALRKLLKPDS